LQLKALRFEWAVTAGFLVVIAVAWSQGKFGSVVDGRVAVDVALGCVSGNRLAMCGAEKLGFQLESARLSLPIVAM